MPSPRIVYIPELTCPVQLIHPKGLPPTWGTDTAMGCDFTCVGGIDGLVTDNWPPEQVDAWVSMGKNEDHILRPGGSMLFRTGIAIAIPPGYGCVLWDRSSMGGKKKIHRLAGVIDEDYRGEWFVSLVNHDQQSHVIRMGDKIVQGLFQTRVRAIFPVVSTLNPTVRGTGGFGSTGQ